MDKKQQEFLRRLRETFRVEADEHLRAMSAGILRLESGLAPEDQAATLEVIFREAHSLKGAARAVNLMEIESVCQSLEGLFSALKRGEITLSHPLYDRFHSALSLIAELIAALGAEPDAAAKSRMVEVVRELGESLHGPSSSPPPEVIDEMPMASLGAAERSDPQPAVETKTVRRIEKDVVRLPETVRISTSKLNAILLQAEEMLAAKLTLGQRVVELREVAALLAPWERERAKVQPDLRMLLRGLGSKEKVSGNGVHAERRGIASSSVARVATFSRGTDHALKLVQSKLLAVAKSAEQDRRTLSTMVDRLLEDTRKALMLPFTSLLEAIPKLVRDLAGDSGKDVALTIQGGEIEVDRRILEEMKDPLVHLIRNCVDHGIEKPQERERKKKKRQGAINIVISQRDGGKVEIRVSDDGAGINLAEVRTSALKAGVVSETDLGTMGDSAIAALIFKSGVTTSPMVTDLSGRGLGLAIVREKVDKLGGNLVVETHPGEGATFRMFLPLSLAAFRGVLVRSEEQLLIIPSVEVLHTLRTRREQIKSVENREVLEQEGRVIPLVSLAEVLGIPRKVTAVDPSAPVYIVVLSATEQRMAFVVEEIVDEQEILVKSLGRNLMRVRNITGAAVLGTGKVVPVLNVADLMQSALHVGATLTARDTASKPVEQKRGRLLVAEDSITTRTLLKNILESAGYRVKTAMDGVDALTSLRAEEFDLVVSDVDMPRMNGFGLAAAIRADKRLAELPVVLVTALESREDRERGIDVGANAYIVKSSFEQSNLLEVVRRLI